MFAGWDSHSGKEVNLRDNDVPSNVSCSFWLNCSSLCPQRGEVVTRVGRSEWF